MIGKRTVVRGGGGGGGGAGIGNATVYLATAASLTLTAWTPDSITLAAIPAIDGYVPPDGYLVLVKSQTGALFGGAKANGIYRVSTTLIPGTGYVWSRSGTLTSGMLCSVLAGVRNSAQVYVLTTLDPIVLGTSLITWLNRNYAGFASVLAAGTALSATMDGVSIPFGSSVLLLNTYTSGPTTYTLGVYVRNFDGSWSFEATVESVSVRQGTLYGQMTMYLNSSSNGYNRPHAVWA